MTKTIHPNEGHSPNNGQRSIYQSVRYSDSPLTLLYSAKIKTNMLIEEMK